MFEQYMDSVRREEIAYPKLFASYAEREYGILYYMEDNRDSYEGNHGCLYPEKIQDLGTVLEDITAFYRALGRRALLYHPFEKDYFRRHEGVLQAHG